MDISDLVEQGKIKRIFRARNKISYPGAVCHITQRAAGIEPLFLEDGDYLYMLHLLKNSTKEFKFDLFSYALMPNHLHLLIRLSKDNLSEGMKHLYRRYAIYFNKKYERKGHVFGGAFRQALCFDDNYFLASSLYIHLNPVKAKLVHNPAEYRWSSCKLYVEPFKGKTFIDYEFISKILHSDINKAQIIYKEMLSESMKIKTQEVWEAPKTLESFRIKIIKFLPTVTKIKSNLKENFLDEQKLEEKIIELKTKGRLRSPETLKARKFLIEQLQARGYSMEIIAEILNISRQTIYRAL